MRPDEVRLLGYPVALGMALTEHVEDWTREFRLIQLGRSAGTAGRDVPARLLELVDLLASRYSEELSEPARRRREAAARGDATVDLAYPVVPETAQVVRSWQRVLAEVDAHCVGSDLLTLPRSPEQVALTDWTCAEFLRQIDGEPPRPWTGPLA